MKVTLFKVMSLLSVLIKISNEFVKSVISDYV
jgi:hypothetical protein